MSENGTTGCTKVQPVDRLSSRHQAPMQNQPPAKSFGINRTPVGIKGVVGRRLDQPTPRSIAVDGNARSWIEMIAARGAGGVNPVRAVVSTYSDHSFTRRRPTGCLRTWVCVIGRAATYSSSRQLVAHPTKVSQMGTSARQSEPARNAAHDRTKAVMVSGACSAAPPMDPRPPLCRQTA